MVEFKWIITEDLENYPFEDPRKEYLYISGDFCMILNNQEWGVAPRPAEVYEFVTGSEDLLFLFQEFKENVLPLENNAEACVRPLVANLIIFVFTRVNDKLFISDKFVKMDKIGEMNWTEVDKTGEIRWTVEVGFEEFCKVCEANIKEFRETVIKRNPILAENESIKRLS